MTLQHLQHALTLNRCDMDQPRCFLVAGGVVAVHSRRSPTRDGDNEDGALICPVDAARAVLAVADGVGGHRAGDEAADLAMATLARCIAAVGDDPLRTGVLDGIEQANAGVTDLGGGAATTLAAVEIEGATVRAYHVGDSAILVVGQRGRIKLRTVDHSPVGYAVEAGLLDEAEAIHHADRHLVSNIVGSPEMRIEIGQLLTLGTRDTLVLGTDGLYDNLHVAEIVEIVRKGPLAKAAEALADACGRRMRRPEPGHPSKPDDLTFVLYRRRP